jgi:hypothetical protein
MNICIHVDKTKVLGVYSLLLSSMFKKLLRSPCNETEIRLLNESTYHITKLNAVDTFFNVQKSLDSSEELLLCGILIFFSHEIKHSV